MTTPDHTQPALCLSCRSGYHIDHSTEDGTCLNYLGYSLNYLGYSTERCQCPQREGVSNVE